MELIDKSALVAEIERRVKEHHSGYLVCLKDMLSFLDTLEVKEVDLEKEYDNEFFKDPIFGKLVNRNAGISIAKHFFEFGLKERKGE